MKRNRHHWAINTLVAVYYGVPVVMCLSPFLLLFTALRFGHGGEDLFVEGLKLFAFPLSAAAWFVTGGIAWPIRVVIQNCIKHSRGDDYKNAGIAARAIVGAIYIVIGLLIPLCVSYINIPVR